jgi:hypothetical protein
MALKKKYGPARLEAACKRALHFDNIQYQTVKNILKGGLDQLPTNEETNEIALAATYTGTCRFMRPSSELELSVEGRCP